VSAETVGYPQEKIRGKDSELVRDAYEKLRNGQSYRESQRQQGWQASERQYKGDQWVGVNKGDPTSDLTVVNISFSTINTIQPYVTGEQPVFFVEAYGAGATEKNARLIEAFLNRTWRAQKTGAQPALETAAMDYLLYGDGFLKASWDIIEKLTGIDTTTEIAALFVDRISPWDVWIDPNSDGITNARWVCQRIYTTLDDIESDERYVVPKDGIETSSRATIKDDRVDDDKPLIDSTEEWVVLYEFYDIAASRMVVFTENGVVPLQVVEEILCPIVQIPNFLIPNSPWHMGELEQIKTLQEELNKTRSEQMTHRRRNVSKVLMKESSLSDTAQSALMSPVVGEVVPIAGDQPLDDLVKGLNMQPIPSDNYAMSDVIKNDVFEITGVTDFQRGATPDIRRTATEISVMEGASNVKLRSKLASIEHAVRKIGELLLGMAKDIFPDTDVDELEMTLAGTEAARVNRLGAGEQAAAAMEEGDMAGAAQAVQGLEYMSEATFTPKEEIFVGVYEVYVLTGSTEFRSPQAKANKYKDLFITLTERHEALAQAGVNVNLGEVLRLWLDAEDVMDVEGIIGSGAPTPPPEAPPQPEAQGMMPPGMEQMMAGGAPAGGEQLPPELMAMLEAAGPPPEQLQGAPAMVGPENSGMLPPVG